MFVSFTLSQWGMVRHWTRTARSGARRTPARLQRSRAVNGVGACCTALVLVVVLVTKFTHGAWIVVLAMPALFVLMKAISTHYARVADELRPRPAGVALPAACTPSYWCPG